MSDFDPETFLHQTVDAPLATEFTMVPKGEYMAAVDDFDSSVLEKVDFEYKKGQRAGTPGTMYKFNCPIVINDEAVKQALQREKVIVTKQFILDLDEHGQLTHGVNKNVELGQLRDAVNQNAAGNWNVAQLRGAGPLMVKVDHVKYKRSDGTNGERAEIVKMVRIV